MRYFGGKTRIANDIAGIINPLLVDGITYWEPFVGGGSVLSKIKASVAFASDKHSDLIHMWTALQNGWEPPDNVSEFSYKLAKRGAYRPEKNAFIGFGCSFAGKYFGGYARDNTSRNYAKNAKNSLLKKFSTIPKNTKFFHADFLSVSPPAEHCVIYCDPPYFETTQYKSSQTKKVETFSSDLFWQRVRFLSAMGHQVFVSEYTAPEDFISVYSRGSQTDIRNGNNEPRKTVEKLFTMEKGV